ncbi:hypothetical protein [Haloarchaeobius amylolyticus]|uniref:hypothetical protein n=1 Tax=Haloarchaeobius amylolyticus TaxID=1198296 RepID=UPI00226D426A|nr:hypothetical protein [Haloarchaeobius amylolyticus]
MKRRTLTAVGFAALLLTSSVFGVVGATPDETTTAPEPTGDWSAELAWYLGLFDLSDDQVDAIVAEAERMQADGASAAEIRREVVDSLRQYGVDERDIREKSQLRVLYRLQGHYDLTDAQLDELTTMVVTMYDEGEAIPEIKHAVVRQLQDYGVDTTALEDRLWQARYEHLLARFDLSESEARLVVAEARALFEKGATWDDIQDSVRANLREFDAQRVDRTDWRQKLHHVKQVHDLAHRYGLSGEEVRDVVTTARDLRENGADRAEVRQAVRETVRQYTTDDRKRAAVKRVAHHLHDESDLTREEIRTALTEARDLRNDGASWAEVREYIRERAEELSDEESAGEASARPVAPA